MSPSTITGLAVLAVSAFLISILSLLRSETRMSHFGAQYDDLLESFKVNTDKVAEKLDHLLAALAAQKAAGDPMTDEQFAQFVAIRDHLAALGSDIQLPTPVVPAVVLAIPVAEHPAPAPFAAPVVTDAAAPTLPAVAVAPAVASSTASDPAPESTPTL